MRKKKEGMVRALLDANSSVLAFDYHCDSPLQYARRHLAGGKYKSIWSSLEEVNRLKGGAKTTYPPNSIGVDTVSKEKATFWPLNEWGWTVQHLLGRQDILEALLAPNSDTYVREMLGLTALHMAIIMSHTEAVEILLQRGGDVWARNHCGRTALHLAVKNSAVREIITMLLNAGETREAFAAETL